MKLLNSIFIILVGSGCIFNSCKEESIPVTINIKLDNAQLSVVRSYISGNWKLVYTNGGFPFQTVYPHNEFYKFQEYDKIVNIRNNDTIVYDTIVWVRYPHAGDTLNFMTYEGLNTLPYTRMPLKISNDTLIIKDVSSDPTFYYLIKN